MLRLFVVLLMVVCAGCDYFDANPAKDSTPVILPPNADWELIATLQRNPLSPGNFYIFEEQSTAMIEAYVDGKHFIFEFSGEYRDDAVMPIRHYIIQPTKPFLEEHKSPARVYVEKKEGVKWQTHEYFFESEDSWYASVDFDGPYGTQPGAIGFSVEFTVNSGEKRAHWVAYTHAHTRIGLSDRSFSGIGTAHSYINENTRLRVYVSRWLGKE